MAGKHEPGDSPTPPCARAGESRGPGTVCITGAARGIGRGVAEHLLGLGGSVVLVDRDPDLLERTADELGAGTAEGRVRSRRVDVSDEGQVRDLFQEPALARLDGLVLCAGIAQAETGPVEFLSLEHWNRYLATNLTGTFLCVKHAVPALRRAQGVVVTLGSTRARQSEPNTEAYAATKGGIVALTHALAVSLGPLIRVHCISPGWIDTGAISDLREIDHLQHPVGRVGRPSDVGRLVAYLLSEKEGFLTGQELVLDGGMSKRMLYAP